METVKNAKQLQADYDKVYADIQAKAKRKMQLEKSKKPEDAVMIAELDVLIKSLMTEKLKATNAINAAKKAAVAEPAVPVVAPAIVQTKHNPAPDADWKAKPAHKSHR